MIRNLPQRIPEIGRLRMGDKETVPAKSGSGTVERPRKAEHWIFSCDDELTLKAVASIHGGDVEAWENGEQAYRLYSETTSIDVLIPPDPLFSAYERWGSGGCARRCDSQTCTVPETSQDGNGGQLVEQPCWCAQRNLTPGDAEAIKKGACDLAVRLKVVIPDVPGLGIWVLTTGSVYAAMELPGQVALLEQLGGGGLVPAVLVLDQRTEKKAWEKYERRFAVPSLIVRKSLRQLADASGHELGSGMIDAPALNAARESSRPSTISNFPPHVQQVIYRCGELGITRAESKALVRQVTNGRTETRKDLTVDESVAIMGLLANYTHPYVETPAPVTKPQPASELRKAQQAAADTRAAHMPVKPVAEKYKPIDTTATAKSAKHEIDPLTARIKALPPDLRVEAKKFLLDLGYAEDVLPEQVSREHYTAFAEFVERLAVGATPAEATDWKAAAKNAGVTQAALLREARSLAYAFGAEEPTSLDEIGPMDLGLGFEVSAWLNQQREDKGGAA